MKKAIILIIVSFFTLQCAVKSTAPPKTDLSGYSRIGIVEFAVKNARGVLDEMATERLAQHLREYYKNAEIVLLENPPETFGKKPEELRDTVREIASAHELDALFLGVITVSDFRPDMKLGSLMKRSRIRTKFRMTAELKLFHGGSGEQIWKDSYSREGHASYDHFAKNINPDFYVSDKDESYVRFVRNLIYHLTEDLRPSYK